MSFRKALTYVLWPGLLFLSTFGMYVLEALGLGLLTSFLCVYGLLLLAVLVLERVLPRTDAWLEEDGQLGNDLLFGFITQLMVNNGGAALLAVAARALLFWAASLQQPHLWPTHWPFFLQVLTALTLVDLLRYWGHRWSHTTSFFWRFHAIHHSVQRLWVGNGGRVHPGDSLPLLLSASVIPLLGIPPDVVLWQGAFTAFIGLMGHSNIDMRPGVLSYVFNTPVLHRWHHSNLMHESQHNYAHTFSLLDLLFGSFHDPRNALPAQLGVGEPFPERFTEQLMYPLRGASRAEERGHV